MLIERDSRIIGIDVPAVRGKAWYRQAFELAARGENETVVALSGRAFFGLGSVLAPASKDPEEFWIATHQDLRRNARVRALLNYLAIAAKTDRVLLEGTQVV